MMGSEGIMKIKKVLLCLSFIFILCSCADSDSYERSREKGKVVNITLSEMKEKMESKDTFAIAFVTTYCTYCQQFHAIFDEYIKDHEVVLYQVILDYETTTEDENLAQIHPYFPEFYTTPGIFYVVNGEKVSYLDTYHSGITSDIIDEWVVEYKMDEKN